VLGMIFLGNEVVTVWLSYSWCLYKRGKKGIRFFFIRLLCFDAFS